MTANQQKIKFMFRFEIDSQIELGLPTQYDIDEISNKY